VTSSRATAEAFALLERAIAARVFPAASVDVGSASGSLWSASLGTLTFEPGSSLPTADTPFDLASLTKVVATTTVLMDLVRRGRVRTDEPIAQAFDEWRGADRARVTVRDMLEHASGLPARLLDRPPASRREFAHEICRIPLEYVPRTRSIYSDLDFILLGFLAADRGGASLPELFGRIMGAGGDGQSTFDVDHNSSLTFELAAERRQLAAPTIPLLEDARKGRMLVGEVHDNYAAALGGAAGHAGLFGSAGALGAFARAVIHAARGGEHGPPPMSPTLLAEFTSRSTVPGSSRALGWDTMLPSSSCGTRMSTRAFGHVGFTGTSLWIDPDRDRYFVLLTNRACGGGTLDQMRDVRRAFHDALGDF
jgi:serine-type D-Ala-D-Ala carboxypeptidase